MTIDADDVDGIHRRIDRGRRFTASR